MTATEPQPAVPKPPLPWCRLTPGRCLAGLLAVEGLLWLSDRLAWLPWHKGYAVLTAVVGLAAALLGLFLWFAVALIFRSRFQFSIRSLLVLTLVVALPCSWLAVEMRVAKRQKEAVAGFRHAHANVTYQYGDDACATYFVFEELGIYEMSRPYGPAWLHDFLGMDFFNRVTRITVAENGGFRSDFGDDDLQGLDAVPDLRELNLLGVNLTDAGLDHLRGLRRLEALEIVGWRQSQFTAAGVAKLQRALPNCKIER
jgi:hypothetical protein